MSRSSATVDVSSGAEPWAVMASLLTKDWPSPIDHSMM